MKRAPTKLPTTTWEYYSTCIHFLGASQLVKMYSKSHRQIERWAADPATTDSHQRNPVDRLELTLEKLIKTKNRKAAHIARELVRRLAAVVGMNVSMNTLPTPDKNTLFEECLDDLPVLAKYHETLRDKESSREQVLAAMFDVQVEIQENYVSWCNEKKINP